MRVQTLAGQRFPVWFKSPEIYNGEWNSIFRKFQKRGQPRKLNRKFFEISYREFPFFELITDYLETFPGNLRLYHL